MVWKKRRTPGTKTRPGKQSWYLQGIKVGLLMIACTTTMAGAWYGLRKTSCLLGVSAIPTSFIITFHHLHDPATRERLEAAVTAWEHENLTLPHVMPALEALKSEDHLVYKSKVQVDARRQCHIAFWGVEPLSRINDKKILGVDGRIYDAKRYPNIEPPYAPLHLSKKDVDGAELVTVAQQLPAEDWRAWNITYHSLQSIVLTPTDPAKKYLVVTDIESLTDKKKYNQIPGIEMEIAQRNKTLRRRERWIFDLRFAHQIVVRKEQKGEGL
jgi:hypothetical protein